MAGRVVCKRDGTTLTYRMPKPGSMIVQGSLLLPLGLLAILFVSGRYGDGAFGATHPTGAPFALTAAVLGTVGLLLFVVVIWPLVLAYTRPQLVRVTEDTIEVVNPTIRRRGSWRAAIRDVEFLRMSREDNGSSSSTTLTILPWAGEIRIVASTGVGRFGRTLSNDEQIELIHELRARLWPGSAHSGPEADHEDEELGEDLPDDADDVVERTYKDL